MQLSADEYQSFKVHFYCTALPDEEYRVPIRIQIPGGIATWTAYVSGADFHPSVAWINEWRRALMAEVTHTQQIDAVRSNDTPENVVLQPDRKRMSIKPGALTLTKVKEV